MPFLFPAQFGRVLDGIIQNNLMMKVNRIHLLLMLVLGVLLSSCTVYHDASGKRVPPGQAKKMYGTKSAKPFAPGQRKKQH
ncbi:hypothetical protein DLD77_05940 [Chitinophaga alhagiae]|uniref:Quinol oxidase subunit 4 n=1 Tax=Chitinophaga alhagiae TaxID=2203219 RepID=A0ABN5LPV8_9BACT|nr:hypothetical protein DLD77_05940 [Chitinophaga alhagiae]